MLWGNRFKLERKKSRWGLTILIACFSINYKVPALARGRPHHTGNGRRQVLHPEKIDGERERMRTVEDDQ